MTWSHVVLVAAGMVLMLLLQSLFWPGRGLVWRKQSPATATLASRIPPGQAPSWGDIHYTPIALDRPEEYFKADLTGAVQTAWVFRNHTEQQLHGLFSTLALPAATLAQLTNRAHWEFLPRAIRVSPPPQAIVSLPPEARKQLYHLLAQNPENVLQATPFRFRADGFADWFAECGLPPEKIDLVRQLTYLDGASLCFADAPAFAQLATAAETKALLKCLWRVSTFVMKLRVTPSTDVESMLAYWGATGAGKTYKPLIDSMSRVPAGSEINVSYFLPPFARLRLYTYPDPRDPNVRRQDCFWTAMNFFNSTPDNGFFDPAYTQRALKAEYIQPRDDVQKFGDLLLLLGHDNQALHMCVYVADDVVFTKNGANPQQPWVLMRISEMLGEYEKAKPFEIVRYRRVAPPQLNTTGRLSAGPHSL